MEPIHTRCCVYALEYHVVWCVKYRHRVLNETIQQSLYGILRDKALEHGCYITEANGGADHVHILIQIPPTIHIPELMQKLKGYSARELFRLYPNPSYYIATVSENTESQIRHYIQTQEK